MLSQANRRCASERPPPSAGSGVGKAWRGQDVAWARRGVGETVGMGVLLRRAVPGDELAVAELHVRSWQVAYRRLLPDEFLDALRPEERASRYTFAGDGPEQPVTTLALDPTASEAVAGFVTFGPSRDADRPADAEIYALYVDPRRFGSGVGRALLIDARRRLVSDGYGSALLWVLAGNERAAAFYAVDGWVPDGTDRVEDVHGVTARVTRFRRSLV